MLTGKGSYAADGKHPDMLVAVLVRSPHAHADVSGIDCAAARAMPGVVGVFTQADLTDVGPIPGGIGFPRPDGGPAPKTDRTLLASDRVRFVGEPVALVVADTRGAALGAAEAVVVDYRAREVVIDPIAAMHPGAPAVWDDVPDNIGFLWKRGDAERTEQALRDAAHVTKLQFFVSRVTANSMEPRGAWAEVGGDGRLVLHASIQSPFPLRNGLAQNNFKLEPTDIRVLPGDVGGSFGMKSGVQQEYALVCWAARKLGRPVRWISDRTEGLLTDEQAREMSITAELGLDAGGKITALRLRWDVNLGAYVSCRLLAGRQYRRHRRRLRHPDDLRGVLRYRATNTVPTAAYRGAGRPEATYTIERLIDVAARELGIDPYELRRRNLIPPGSDAVQDRADLHV